MIAIQYSLCAARGIAVITGNTDHKNRDAKNRIRVTINVEDRTTYGM